MKKHFISTLGLLFIAFFSTAQDTVLNVSRNRFANLDVSVGYLNSDIRSVNNFLSAYGYKRVSDNFVTFSVSPSVIFNRFVLRAEYTWQLRSERPQDGGLVASFGGRHNSASIGYVVLQKPGVRIYPYVGVNAFVSNLVVRERPSASTLDDLVANRQQAFHLAYSNASLDFGVQFDKLFLLRNRRFDCPQNAQFMTLGLRIGYLYGPGEVKGRFNGNIVEDAPTYSPNGMYIKLVLGLSTKMRALNWKR